MKRVFQLGMQWWIFFAVILLTVVLNEPSLVFALQPEEIIVIANRSYEDSVELAEYYMEKRRIPKENLLRISTTNKEFCSREDFNEDIVEPVRKFLLARKQKTFIRCLVLMRGIPLRIDPPRLTSAEINKIEKLKKEVEDIKTKLKITPDQKSPEALVLISQHKNTEKKIKIIQKKDYRAAVDSELALILAKSYPLDGWIPNPFFMGFQNKTLMVEKGDVLFVSRLDAPTGNIVKRVIDDSIETEKIGLKGTAYIDARWKKTLKKNLQGYAFYDDSLHNTAEYLNSSRLMPVVLNSGQVLFQPGEAPGAALYAGWYSHHQYVDAFDWKPGAIGYHIASSECSTLRSGTSQVWCKRMLEDGVAATLGPVGEPYVQAFPVPEIFFKMLTDSYYTLVEAYFLSLPYLSWQMVLVGDPLYRPFKNAP